MIRVLSGIKTTNVETKTSSRVGVSKAPLASLGRASDDPLPARDDPSPKRKRKKKT